MSPTSGGPVGSFGPHPNVKNLPQWEIIAFETIIFSSNTIQFGPEKLPTSESITIPSVRRMGIGIGFIYQVFILNENFPYSGAGIPDRNKISGKWSDPIYIE